MPEKYKGKYRTSSIRLQTWDYSWSGAYFITICTHKMQHFFGEITDGKMNLSPTGVLADVFWHEIKSHSKNVELDEFVVMPNHVHGIIILDGNNDADDPAQRQGMPCLWAGRPAKNDIRTREKTLSLQS